MNKSKGLDRRGRQNAWKNRKTNKIFSGRHEGKRLLGIYSHEWETNAIYSLKETGSANMEWIIWLAIGPVSGSCEHRKY
jgi:hypothetical protein